MNEQLTRVIYRENETVPPPAVLIVQPDTVYMFYNDGATSSIKGSDVIKTARKTSNVPYKDRPIQNVSVDGKDVLFYVVEVPSNMLSLNLRYANVQANFDLPFQVAVRHTSDASGEILLGNYILPFSVEPVHEMYNLNEGRGERWVLGDHLISRVIYTDQINRGVLIKNIEIDTQTGVMTGNLLFDVGSPNSAIKPNNFLYHMRFNFETGCLTLEAGDNVYKCKCASA